MPSRPCSPPLTNAASALATFAAVVGAVEFVDRNVFTSPPCSTTYQRVSVVGCWTSLTGLLNERPGNASANVSAGGVPPPPPPPPPPLPPPPSQPALAMHSNAARPAIIGHCATV